MAGGVEQMGLPQSGGTPDEQRVVGPRRGLGDRHRRSVCEPVRRTDHEGVEGVLRVEAAAADGRRLGRRGLGEIGRPRLADGGHRLPVVVDLLEFAVVGLEHVVFTGGDQASPIGRTLTGKHAVPLISTVHGGDGVCGSCRIPGHGTVARSGDLAGHRRIAAQITAAGLYRARIHRLCIDRQTLEGQRVAGFGVGILGGVVHAFPRFDAHTETLDPVTEVPVEGAEDGFAQVTFDRLLGECGRYREQGESLCERDRFDQREPCLLALRQYSVVDGQLGYDVRPHIGQRVRLVAHAASLPLITGFPHDYPQVWTTGGITRWMCGWEVCIRSAGSSARAVCGDQCGTRCDAIRLRVR